MSEQAKIKTVSEKKKKATLFKYHLLKVFLGGQIRMKPKPEFLSNFEIYVLRRLYATLKFRSNS